MTGDDVDDAVTEMVRVLGPHVTADWTVGAGTLDWSCWTTAAHVADDLLAYASQVAGGATTAYLPFDLNVHADTPPADVLQVVAACGSLLSGAIAVAAPDARAWHFGPSDTGGFAAMGVGETLLHTYDIAAGLGIPWRPSARLSAGVLRRLVPDAPQGDPVDVLLWRTGRADLDGHPPPGPWGWHAAVGS
ncbi:MAG: hypothetical protein GEV10_23260 [Streptosporangiales bacterium]|nr:hypothetical protein [Streptosporangiales bacterium]